MYKGTLKVYRDDAILESFPTIFQFEGELAIDQGGVCRDMFSAFWEAAFEEQFDGTSLLAPINHAGLDFEALPTIGRIMSHGYLSCGFLPIRVAFPCIVHVLRGQVAIADWILLESFVDSLNVHESHIMKEAFAMKDKESPFPASLNKSLLGILARYGCRNLPNPANLQSWYWML